MKRVLQQLVHAWMALEHFIGCLPLPEGGELGMLKQYGQQMLTPGNPTQDRHVCHWSH